MNVRDTLGLALLFLCLSLIPIQGLAQNAADGYRPAIEGGNVLAVAIQTDGKAIIGGTFTEVDGVVRNRLARLNPDGSLDTGFNPNVNEAVLAIAIQDDGRILIGGDFSQVSGQARPFLAWLNSNGTLRNAPPAPNGTVRAIQVLPGVDRFIIGGSFLSVASAPQQRLARYRVFGSRLLLDSNVVAGFNAEANNTVNALARDSAGRILVGGQFTQINGQPRSRLARISANGNVDASFSVGADSTVSALAVQPDDAVIVAGAFGQLGGQPRVRIGRVSANGGLDPGFIPTADAAVNQVLVQADGGIVVGGSFTNVSGVDGRRVARLLPDGSVDPDFQVPASTASSFAAALAQQPDGKLLVGGNFPAVGGRLRNKVLRLYGNGRLDDHYIEGLTTAGGVSALAVQADGAALVGGNFGQYAGISRTRLARLLVDGRLDTTFAPSITGATVRAIAVLNDESIVIGGSFTQVGGQNRNRLARLTPQGDLVVGFAPSFNDLVTGVAVQAIHAIDGGTHPGGLLVAGSFTSISGVPRNKLARILDDGSVDPAFNPSPSNGAVAADIHALTIQANGDIVIGGFFNSVGGQTRNNLARLRATGAVDPGFTPVVSSGHVRSIVELSDGRLLIGGSFTSVNGSSRQRLARLNANGSLDTGFNVAANDTIRTFAFLRDGSVLVGGDFTSFGGLTRNRLARLHADGTVDSSFNPNVAVGAEVRALAVLDDGKLLAGGFFSEVGGLPRAAIARLSMPSALLQSLHLDVAAGRVHWNASAGFPELTPGGPGRVSLDLSLDGEDYLPLFTMVAGSDGWQVSLPIQSVLPSEQIFYLRTRGRHREVGGSSNVIESVRQFFLPVSDRIFADGFQ